MADLRAEVVLAEGGVRVGAADGGGGVGHCDYMWVVEGVCYVVFGDVGFCLFLLVLVVC